MWNIYEKSVTRTFLGAFFWAPIPFKQYQNTSACGTEAINKWFQMNFANFKGKSIIVGKGYSNPNFQTYLPFQKISYIPHPLSIPYSHPHPPPHPHLYHVHILIHIPHPSYIISIHTGHPPLHKYYQALKSDASLRGWLALELAKTIQWDFFRFS